MTVLRLTRISIGLFLALSNLSFAEEVKNVPVPNSRDFMFIYPTIFGPAIDYQGKTYGTGFGVDPVLARELARTDLGSLTLDSYESKLVWGNAMLYPGLVSQLSFPAGFFRFPYAGLFIVGAPFIGVGVIVNGSAYEDLSRSVAFYNASQSKVSFDIRQFGYRLSWNGENFDPHDARILEVLGASTGAKTFIDSYRAKSGTASFLGWSGILLPVAGVAFGLQASSLEGLGIAMIMVGAGATAWTVSNFVGASAEADLVEGVKLYNQTH